jgi:hypothetical protein
MNKFCKDLEKLSFMKFWFSHTNEKIGVDCSNNSIKNKSLEPILGQFLDCYLNNRNYKIVGCDMVSDFKIELSSQEDLERVSKLIWESPEKFYNFEGDSYYNFLKFLWIETPLFNEGIKLTDIINEEDYK